MKLLKKTPIAILIMLATVLLSSLIGGGVSLGKARGEIEAIFYDGAVGDGYSIQDELEMLEAEAGQFKTIASRYIDESDILIKSLISARQSLDAASSPSEKCAAAQALMQELTTIYTALDDCEMNRTDKDFRDSLYDSIKGSMSAIGSSGYNAAAREFNSMLTEFPTAQIAAIAGIGPIEMYK